MPYGEKSGFLPIDSAEILIYTRKDLSKTACVYACSKKDKRCVCLSLMYKYRTRFFRRKIAMRVRLFFWLLPILSCLSVFTFAFLFQRDLPALIEVSLNQPFPKVQQVVALTLHLTDSEGHPIDHASIISDVNMTTMDMGEEKHHLQSLGQGSYTTHLQ